MNTSHSIYYTTRGCFPFHNKHLCSAAQFSSQVGCVAPQARARVLYVAVSWTIRLTNAHHRLRKLCVLNLQAALTCSRLHAVSFTCRRTNGNTRHLIFPDQASAPLSAISRRLVKGGWNYDKYLHRPFPPPPPLPSPPPPPPYSSLLCFVLFSAFFRTLPSSVFIRVCYFFCFPSLFLCSALSVCSVAVVIVCCCCCLKKKIDVFLSFFLVLLPSFFPLLEISFVASVLHQWSLGTLSVLACHVRITASDSWNLRCRVRGTWRLSFRWLTPLVEWTQTL